MTFNLHLQVWTRPCSPDVEAAVGVLGLWKCVSLMEMTGFAFRRKRVGGPAEAKTSRPDSVPSKRSRPGLVFKLQPTVFIVNGLLGELAATLGGEPVSKHFLGLDDLLL